MYGDLGTLIIWAVVVLILGAVALPLLLPIAAALRRAYRITRSPRRTAEATVVDKRVEITANRDAAELQHFVTFGFPDGGRMELGVTGRDAGMLTVGDQGQLDWQGPRLHGFTREIYR